MLEYRIYFLDDSGTIVGSREMRCVDDEEARLRVYELLRSCEPRYPAAEIWRSHERIDKVQADHLAYLGRLPPKVPGT